MWRMIGLIALAVYLIVKIVYETILENDNDNLRNYIRTKERIHQISKSYSEKRGESIE